MTARKFYDWQTAGGADDVMRMVDTLECAEVSWCAISGIAVNHWAAEPMVTQDVDFVVAVDQVDQVVELLTDAGFSSKKFEWSINFKGISKVSIQLSTENVYREFASRSVAADIHGMLMRVACLEDTLHGEILAWSDKSRRQSKRIKDLGDIARLVESHPALWQTLPTELKDQVDRPE
jgi:hypothetical protein